MMVYTAPTNGVSAIDLPAQIERRWRPAPDPPLHAPCFSSARLNISLNLCLVRPAPLYGFGTRHEERSGQGTLRKPVVCCLLCQECAVLTSQITDNTENKAVNLPNRVGMNIPPSAPGVLDPEGVDG